LEQAGGQWLAGTGGAARVLAQAKPGLITTRSAPLSLRAYTHITLSMLALAWLAASKAQTEKGDPHQ
jgi:hypothetical protein